MSYTIDELVAAYRKVRDTIKAKEEAHDAEIASLKESLETVAQGLLDFCNEQNLDSIRTPMGTVSRRVSTRYWTTDWDATYQFIMDYDAPFLLEKRIQNTNMAQFLEENPELHPPGLQIDRKYVVQVRKPTAK